MLYLLRIQNKDSLDIIKKGKHVVVDQYMGYTGDIIIGYLDNKYYLIIFDGTEDQYYHSHAPEPISETEAKIWAVRKDKDTWLEACEEFGWDESEYDYYIGIYKHIKK